MRLDHLLSRERSEGWEARAKPEVEMSGSSYEENAGRQTGEARAEEKDASDESIVLEYSFTVSL